MKDSSLVSKTLDILCHVGVVYLVVSLSQTSVAGQNTGYGGGVADSQGDLEAALDYMKKYQGLPQSTRSSGVGTLISHTDIASSIRNMQRYMDVPLSGRIDPATVAKMGQPRCGVPDPSGQDQEGHALGGRMRRYAHTGGRWTKNKLTYRILNSPNELSVRHTNEELRLAFQVWEAVTPLEFTKVASGRADIYLSFGSYNHGDDYPFDGPGFTLAHAFPPQSGWGDLDGDVHFDDAETFTRNTFDGTNLFQVAAHEIGHSLGLAHSTEATALMAPFYQGYIENFRLPYDDQLGIQTIYGPSTRPVNPTTRKPQPGPDPGPNPGPTTRGPDTRCRQDYDAISLIRGELFAFQAEKYWRLRFPQELISRDNGEMTDLFWNAFPNNIDAAYERYYDQKIFFFKGSQYYKYNGLSLVPGYPQPIRNLDPNLPNNLDAVIGFEEYSKTYFIKGRKVWRFDELEKRVDAGYPVNIRKVFPGVPSSITSAFLHSDGAAYFLNGYEYYRYNDTMKKVDKGYPRRFGVDFLGCDPLKMTRTGNSTDGNGASDGTGGVGYVGTGGVGYVAPTQLCVLISAVLALMTLFMR